MSSTIMQRLIAVVLGLIQLFLALSALAGGFKLVSQPRGSADFPIAWLENSPFDTYLIPGIVLILAVGLANVLAFVFTLVSRRYRGLAAAAVGVILLVFMATEIMWIGLRSGMQPLSLVLGSVLLAGGLALHRLAPTAPDSPAPQVSQQPTPSRSTAI